MFPFLIDALIVAGSSQYQKMKLKFRRDKPIITNLRCMLLEFCSLKSELLSQWYMFISIHTSPCILSLRSMSNYKMKKFAREMFLYNNQSLYNNQKLLNKII